MTTTPLFNIISTRPDGRRVRLLGFLKPGFQAWPRETAERLIATWNRIDDESGRPRAVYEIVPAI